MRFSIRDLLWATLVVAMGLGWWIDHGAMQSRCEDYVAVKERSLIFEEAVSELRAEVRNLRGVIMYHPNTNVEPR